MQRPTISRLFLCFCAAFVPAVPPLRAAEIESPTFEPPVQSFHAPMQTGSARAAAVDRAGLYEVADPAVPVYVAGRRLPVLYEHLVFVRGVDDFYTGKSVVWSGNLEFRGDPGMVPPPHPNALVNRDGVFRVIARAEQDVDFQHNYLKGCAPNWYFDKSFNIIGVVKDAEGQPAPHAVEIGVDLRQPLLQGAAELRLALNADAPPEKPNSVTISVNNTIILDAFGWNGPGYRILRQSFPATLLHDGQNQVKVLGDATYVKHLDYVEIEAPANPALPEHGLVLRSDAATTITVPGAAYAVDITDFGAERALPEGADRETFELAPGRLYYFAATHTPLAFGEPRQLALPAIKPGDYLVLGTDALRAEADSFVDWKRSCGFPAQALGLQEVLDVFNGGMYGPDGITALLRRTPPEYLLIFGGFHRDCRGREAARQSVPDWHPGVPAGLRQLEQLTTSDDIYSLNNTVKLGRVPLNNPRDVAAWMDKARAYQPPDHVVLLSGKDDKVEFSAMQRLLERRFPAACVEAQGQLPEVARDELVCAMEQGATLVLYQGHAQSWAVDGSLLDGSYAAVLPMSSWVLATCNSAYYHADFDVYVRDWMAAPDRGCVQALGASSVGAAGQQDQLVRRFLEGLRVEPSMDWGGMLQYLKENLPLEAKTMADPNLPEFIRRTIPADRMTIDAYSLLGDPAAPVLAAAPRAVAIETATTGVKEKGPLPVGPVALKVVYSGPWSAESLAAGRVALEWRPGGAGKWQVVPPTAVMHPGENEFQLDALALGQDGGRIDLRIVEFPGEAPPVVWTSTSFTQESFLPVTPVAQMRQQVIQRISPRAVVVCGARTPGNVYAAGTVEFQFQLRDAAAPEKMLADTGWLQRRRYVYQAGQYPAEMQVRARIKTSGGEGEWSEWTGASSAPAEALPAPALPGLTPQDRRVLRRKTSEP